MKIPSDLRYTAHDEWVRTEGDILTVGITDFAQDQLGEIVHVELPAVGKKVTAGSVVCELESVKAVAEIFAPASGEITAVNTSLDGSEGAINSDPYNAWIYKLKISSAAIDLLDAAAYQAKIG